MQDLIFQLEKLKGDALADISAASTAEDLEKLRVIFLGKKGRLSAVLGGMGKLSVDERPLIGQKANDLKIQLQES